MFGNLGELAKIMGKAKEMQSTLKKFREDAPRAEYTATAADGKIKVVVSGDFEIKELAVDASLSGEELQQELRTALNAAVGAAKSAMRDKMNELTGGIGLDLPVI
ncbi:MAG: YbaB/EbfC family nucleoid-associated protein [Victivallaceae bacterium]|nr:YbaB/EbfC family nucleoid-associated protein [Victivallaceae bacterium]